MYLTGQKNDFCKISLESFIFKVLLLQEIILKLSQPAITCSKVTIKTPERRHRRHSGVFIVNFEHISHLVLVFLLLTLSR